MITKVRNTGRQLRTLALALAAVLAISGTLALAQTNTAQTQDTSAEAYSGATHIELGSESRVLITEAGTYVLSGTLADGMVEVAAAGAAVTLVLNGVDISNSSGPAILFSAASEAVVILADGTHNVIADGGASEFDAALYSDASLTIAGSGSLDVHAVYEGISSTMHINIVGGTIHVWADEDGLNANNDGVSQINVSGGYLYVETTAGDAIDSNGTLTVTGGTVIAQGALVDGNSGLDADGAVTLSSGLVIATGGSMMGSLAAADQQALIVDFGQTWSAGSLVAIVSDSGEQVLVFAPASDFQQLIVSSDKIEAGVTYTVYVGGTATGASVDGLYEAASALGTSVGTVTSASGSQSGQWGGGFPGGTAPGAPGGRMPRN